LSEKEYAAAILTFLERSAQKESKSMCYPITRVEFFNIGDPLPVRIFTVIDGKWVEKILGASAAKN
jgi:hypothetical protein